MTKLLHCLLLLFILLLLAAGCGDRQHTQVSDRTEDSVAVCQLVGDRLEAALAGDTARWHRQVSDSCLWTGPVLKNATTREVLSSIAANSMLATGDQSIQELSVVLHDNIALATYVQLVRATDSSSSPGKRFRKTDTYLRKGRSWELICAAEIAVPYRQRIPISRELVQRLSGQFVLPGVDTLTVGMGANGNLLLSGTDGVTDTLLAENDSTMFQEGDLGSWVFSTDSTGQVVVLRYRIAGAADVLLKRVLTDN